VLVLIDATMLATAQLKRLFSNFIGKKPETEPDELKLVAIDDDELIMVDSLDARDDTTDE
jgi:hypothetical protein